MIVILNRKVVTIILALIIINENVLMWKRVISRVAACELADVYSRAHVRRQLTIKRKD